MKQKMYAVVIGGIIISFFLFPRMVSVAATDGLLLWFQVVLPALLPFLILSSVILGLGLDDSISRFVAPVFTRFFGISKAGCYPVVIGMLSGYPLGAATVAEMVRRDRITTQEAQYILHFCNNASPMFLIEFIGLSCLDIKYPIFVIVIIYLAVWTNAGLERLFRRNSFQTNSPLLLHAQHKQSLIELIDESILQGFTISTKVGGYIILFSILSAMIEWMVPIGEEAGAVITGILEITTGANLIAHIGFSEQWCMVFLIGCSAFGGLSSVVQSASVLSGTGLSVKKYIFAKMRQALIASGYMLLFISLFGTDVLH